MPSRALFQILLLYAYFIFADWSSGENTPVTMRLTCEPKKYIYRYENNKKVVITSLRCRGERKHSLPGGFLEILPCVCTVSWCHFYVFINILVTERHRNTINDSYPCSSYPRNIRGTGRKYARNPDKLV